MNKRTIQQLYLNNVVLILVVLCLISSIMGCASIQSKQLKTLQNLFKQKEKRWYINYQNKEELATVSSIKKNHLTFFSKSNIQLDFNGWEINEARNIGKKKYSFQQKIIEKKDDTILIAVKINGQERPNFECEVFKETKTGYKRTCFDMDFSNTAREFTDTITKNEDDIVALHFFVGKELGYITLSYQ